MGYLLQRGKAECEEAESKDLRAQGVNIQPGGESRTSVYLDHHIPTCYSKNLRDILFLLWALQWRRGSYLLGRAVNGLF